MNVVAKFIDRSRRKGFADTLGLTWCIATGMLDYKLNPFAKRQNSIPKPDYEKIRADMELAGLDVVPYTVDVGKFRDWLDMADFPKEYVDSYKHLFIEKALEHYLGAEILELNSDDVFIDVAAAGSPW